MGELVEDESGYAVFLTFLENQYTQQHLHFWKEVQAYRTEAIKDDCDKKAIEQRAHDMFKKYCKSGTKHQINITDVVKGRLEDSMQEEINSSTFDAVERVCMNLLMGILHLFQETPEYKNWMKKREPKTSSRTCVI